MIPQAWGSSSYSCMGANQGAQGRPSFALRWVYIAGHSLMAVDVVSAMHTSVLVDSCTGGGWLMLLRQGVLTEG